MTEVNLDQEQSFAKNLRNDFLYGLFVILPIVATIVIFKIATDLLAGPVSAILPANIPGFVSFLISIVIITLIGITARNIIGKAVLQFFEGLLQRIPIINTIYRSVNQIINAFNFKNKSLLSSVLVEYPRKGTWVLGFVTNKSTTGLLDKDGNDIGKDKYAIFVPTTPNPTSGYFIYVSKDEVTELAISVEDSIKILMSAGVVNV